MAHPLSAAPHEVPPSLVRAELDRVLASEIFSRSDRLSAFLRFIVDETLAGHGAGLKEQVIAVELYGKGADFNTAADPIVRVDARRLRDKLREFYASSPPGAVIISVPKGSYTPVFEPGDPAVAFHPPPGAPHIRAIPVPPVAARRSRWRWAAAAAIAVVLIGGLAMSLARGRRSAPPRLLTVTSFPGSEDDPTLSPDGNFVAFSWAGPDGGINDDLWVTPVEGDGLRRLTTGSATDKWPQWSPDGRYIAYSRLVRGQRTVVCLISPLGGPERVVSEGAQAAWTPDSRALVMAFGASGTSTIVHHTLDTGVRRQLTVAPQGFAEVHPRVSPDGTLVAFHRNGAGRSAIFVVPIGGGEPRIVGDWASGVIGGLTWAPDGREIIYTRPETSLRRMVRTTLDAALPTPVNGVPFGATGPTVSRVSDGSTYRLGFATGQVDVGLRLIDLAAAPEGQPLGDTAFADATRMDSPGRFSPDGGQVAFASDRGGSPQVWVAARDGSALRSVTRFDSATVNVGSWSPDGQRVVFDATVAGTTDLYVVRTDGGELKRLTESPAIEIDPEWSRDGAWIYYSSNVSGTPTIWKMPAQGGRAAADLDGDRLRAAHVA